ETQPEPQVRDKNGYASSTPVTDGERVIAFLGSCGLVCFDFKGNLLWHHGDVTIRTTHGTGSSPLLYKDLVILVQDQNQAQSIFLALDKRTGKRVWQGKRGPAMTWSTPVVVRGGDRHEPRLAHRPGRPARAVAGPHQWPAVRRQRHRCRELPRRKDWQAHLPGPAQRSVFGLTHSDRRADLFLR